MDILSLLTSILIVYGLSLIIVQGKIFLNYKTLIVLYSDKIDKYLNPNDVAIGEMINNDNNILDLKLKNLYKELFEKYQITHDDQILQLLTEIKDKLKVLYVQNLKNNYKFKYYFYTFLKNILDKFSSLINCMMCTGFWVGVILSISSILFNISIFGSSLHIISSIDTVSIIISCIYMGGLYSGTSWIINAIVDFFVEIKDRLITFIDKKIYSGE